MPNDWSVARAAGRRLRRSMATMSGLLTSRGISDWPVARCEVFVSFFLSLFFYDPRVFSLNSALEFRIIKIKLLDKKTSWG